MTERIDHADEALGLRILASEAPNQQHQGNLLAAAQVHATLAIVEQTRIANIIALDESWRGETGDALMRTLRDEQGHYIGNELNPEIAAALGIDLNGEDDE